MIRLETNPPVSNEALNELMAWASHKPSDFSHQLNMSLAYVCAYEDERLIGFVKLGWDGGIHAFLLDTTVHTEYQRRGIGRQLVRRALEVARERGLEWVHVDYQPHLETFYQSCGFRPTLAGLVNLKQVPQ
ncbi:MAG: GNAT family N-acetyltransferase [Thermaceae bacterium]|nr:GNAT family N-acetyltransferase [Thermaceae bacterium]